MLSDGSLKVTSNFKMGFLRIGGRIKWAYKKSGGKNEEEMLRVVLRLQKGILGVLGRECTSSFS